MLPPLTNSLRSSPKKESVLDKSEEDSSSEQSNSSSDSEYGWIDLERGLLYAPHPRGVPVITDLHEFDADDLASIRVRRIDEDGGSRFESIPE
jgi:hypothetical protein